MAMTRQEIAHPFFRDRVMEGFEVLCDHTGKREFVAHEYWSLFTIKEGWEAVACRLTKAMDEAANAETPEEARNLLFDALHAPENVVFGSADTEARDFACACLSRLRGDTGPQWM